MHVILWRLSALPSRESEFVAAYGDDGIWARFFSTDPAFLGTQLLRGSDGTYLTIDRWDSEETYRAFHERERRRYEGIDAACASLTIEETFLAAVTA